MKLIDCNLCDRSLARKYVCQGRGNTKSHIMVIGEKPDSEDDSIGESFFGLQGKVLRKICLENKYDFDDLYCTYMLKCGTCPSKLKHIHICYNWLAQEIQLVKPKYIILLGAKVSKQFIKGKIVMGKLFDNLMFPWYSLETAFNNAKVFKESVGFFNEIFKLVQKK